jgi:hypothetical protein
MTAETFLQKRFLAAGGILDSPAICQNPFVKGFRHLPKLFIGFTIKSFWKSRNLFSKRFLVVEDILGGGFRALTGVDKNIALTYYTSIIYLPIFTKDSS